MGVVIMTPHKMFAVIGLHRSGTNVVQTLVHENFKFVKFQSADSYFWKHTCMPPKEYNPNFVHLFVTKNPYKWIESMAWRCKHPRILSDFLQTHSWIDMRKGELIGDNQLSIESLCKVYETHCKTYLMEKIPPKFIPIQYEALIDNPRAWLIEVQRVGGFEKKGKEFSKTVPKQVTCSDEHTKVKHDYYMDMSYTKGFEFLTKENILAINECLGRKLFDGIKYNMVELDKAA